MSFRRLLQAPAIGAWSDFHGRKYFFLIAELLVCVPLGVLLLNINYGLPLYWYYIVQVFTSSTSSVTAGLSFIADLLTPPMRAPCFGLILSCFSLALIFGPPIGAQLTPHAAVSLALMTTAVSVLYTWFILPESLSQEMKDEVRRKTLVK